MSHLVNEPLRVENCFVSQHGLRNIGQLKDMVGFIKENGRFNKEGLSSSGPLIQITRFEDGQLYIQDGHHRLCAIILAGRPFLFGDEYEISDWKYSQYEEINFSVNWVTPYEPRTMTRNPDYGDYKQRVVECMEEHGYWAAEIFIEDNANLYCKQREYYHIQAMINRMELTQWT